MHKYYVIYKPFGILSQFTDEGNKKGLASCFEVEHDVYPVGRLDADSEGLLILTSDKFLNHKLLTPSHQHKRVYYAQVEGVVDERALDILRNPMELNYKGKTHTTSGARAELLTEVPSLPERIPPIRQRKHIPTSWIQLEIAEGKNRQVRKMTAKAGLPTLRLVRWGIEGLNIEGYQSGEIKAFEEEKIKSALFQN